MTKTSFLEDLGRRVFKAKFWSRNSLVNTTVDNVAHYNNGHTRKLAYMTDLVTFFVFFHATQRNGKEGALTLFSISKCWEAGKN